MAITTAQVAAYLARRLHNLAALTKQVALDDSVDGFGDDIQDALERMGYSDITAVTTMADQAAIKHLSEFYSLYRYASLLSTRVDIEAYAIDDDRRVIFDNVITLMNEAAEKSALYGYIVNVPGLTGAAGVPGNINNAGVGAVGHLPGGAWSFDNVDTSWKA